MLLSPYFAKSHEDRATCGRDEECEAEEMSRNVARMRVEKCKLCRKFKDESQL